MRRSARDSDPFGERLGAERVLVHHLLGTEFRIECDHPRLAALVEEAYAGLPPQRWPVAAPPVRLRLRLVPDAAGARWKEPPPPATEAGAGLLCGACDAANYAVVAPAARSGLVSLSPRMLRHRYHARYELLEFAVFTLATRVRGLLPLHAGCVVHRGRALLLIGDSGAGKSTFALNALAAGLDFMSEDSAFVCPRSMLVTGIPNFLHLRSATRAVAAAPRLKTQIARSPQIRRRSGARKYELDARRTGLRLATAPARVAALAFLSARTAPAGEELRPLGTREAWALLEAAQPFASSQPGWAALRRRTARLPAYESRRGPSPAAQVASLKRLLEETSR